MGKLVKLEVFGSTCDTSYCKYLKSSLLAASSSSSEAGKRLKSLSALVID